MENYPKKEDKYWVLERKIVFLILFFKCCVVLTWKIVVPPKASVLYIYIDEILGFSKESFQKIYTNKSKYILGFS